MKYLLTLAIVLFATIPMQSKTSIGHACKFKLDEKAKVRIDDHMQGIWKMAEDTDFHNYFVLEKDGAYEYELTYMNKSGDNRGLEHGTVYFSVINHVKFLMVPDWDFDNRGYIYLRIDSVSSPRSWEVVATVVTDARLSNVKSSAELHTLFEKNLNNPAFYGQKIHFRKKFEFNSWK
jgi:hypothetical protein